MANALYDLGRESFLNAEISWMGDTINVSLVDGQEYTPDLATDQFWSDVASGGVIATVALTNKTSAKGVADADPAVFPNVTGDQFEYVVIWQDTGVDATSRLIALIDTASGLAFTPTGTDITVAWDNTDDQRIFKL